MLWSISTLCNDASIINRKLYWFRILVPKKLCQIYSIFYKHLRIEPSNLRKKNKWTIICDRRTIKFDIGTAQCNNGIIKFEKQIKEPLNVTKELSNVMLELHNMRMEASNIRKKVREQPNVRKELSHVMLKLHNVKMKLSNVRKK